MPTKKKSTKEISSYISRLEQLHPFMTITYLLIICCSIFFAYILLKFEITSYQYSFEEQSFYLPDIATVGSFLLFISVSLIQFQNEVVQKEKIYLLKKNIYSLILVTAVSVVCEIITIYQIQTFEYEAMSLKKAYDYCIILFATHLFITIVFQFYLLFLLYRVTLSSHDPVKVLIYFTNPFEMVLLKVQKAMLYFILGVWLVLYFYMLLRF